MSDPKRATLITVGAPKSGKANVNKTVRLTINLDESNESKYPELNYKELVIAEEKKKRVQNGKTDGLDPFSDNDDDVERVARKFEQKYGGKSTYGKKGRRKKQDDFADIGAGYDENDSFIDNTHGYDEMIPPECDTFHGGFYINSGSLEFKNVAHEQSANSDEPANRRNKRRISSSSSEDSSSESSSESESQDGEKDPKAAANGDVDSHKTEHRKKKNKKVDTGKPNKVQRTDSSAATSGKQTSDDNVQLEGESADCADSRTSHSDSLTSKPAPSSENPITSDSSRDVEAKVEAKLPQCVSVVLDALEARVATLLREHPTTAPKQLLANNEQHLLKLEQALKNNATDVSSGRAAWARAAAACGVSRPKLMQRVKVALERGRGGVDKEPSSTCTTSSAPPPPAAATTATTTLTTNNNKRKHDDVGEVIDASLTDEEREALIQETLQRLKALIEERKPSMLANYNAECERVQEERKKIQIASAAEGGPPPIEKRLPKRRFPWCPRTRSLLARLTVLAGNQQDAAYLLAKRALPLFPNGFVRMPTLLRQADLSKEIKVSDVKRQRLASVSQPPTAAHIQTIPQTTANTTTPFEPIQFPSSLTVTTTVKNSPEKSETMETDEKYKSNCIFGSIVNSFSLSKDLIVEKEKKDDKNEELYIPPNNIGCITITPVPNSTKEKKNAIVSEKPSGLIRVKSPAALNDMVSKKEVKVIKKQDKTHVNKRVESPLHIDTSYQPSKKDPSPKNSDCNNSKKDPSPKSLDGNYGKKDPSPKSIEGNYSKKDPSPKSVDGNHGIKDTSPKSVDGNSGKKDPSPKNLDGNYGKKDPSLKSVEPSKKDPSTKGKDETPQRQIECMRVVENNIPRPALIPVHHSPTFAKPDKRPPELKKKKDLIVVSDLDPLADLSEPLNIDDSSSDVEVIEMTDKSDSLVPSKDKKNSVTSVPKVRDGRIEDANDSEIDVIMRNIREMEKKNSVKSVPKVRDGKVEDANDSEMDVLMRNIREMEHSQETTKFNSNSYGGVITSAKHEKCQDRFTRDSVFGGRSDKNKLAERTSLNKTDGPNGITG